MSLFEMNEEKVDVFSTDRIESARKQFNEGWWKGFSSAAISSMAGFIIGMVLVAILDRKEA